MGKPLLLRTLVLTTLLAVLLIACRRDEEVVPTAEPTSPSAETVSTPAEADVEPTATTAAEEAEPAATAAPAPTATPQAASRIAPEDVDWPPQVVA